MKKTFKKRLKNTFLATSLAALFIATPVGGNYTAFAGSDCSGEHCSCEISKNEGIEKLLSRTDKIQTYNELNCYLQGDVNNNKIIEEQEAKNMEKLWEKGKLDKIIQLNLKGLKLSQDSMEKYYINEARKKDRPHMLLKSWSDSRIKDFVESLRWKAYDNLGRAYFNKEEYKKALDWNDKSLSAIKKNSSKEGLISLALENKAKILYELKDFDLALKNINQSLKFYERVNNSKRNPHVLYVKSLIIEGKANSLLSEYADNIYNNRDWSDERIQKELDIVEDKMDKLNRDALTVIRQSIKDYVYIIKNHLYMRGNLGKVGEGLAKSYELESRLEFNLDIPQK